MPVIDKFLIIFQIRCVDPFFYLDLTSVCFGTFMDLKNIFKSPVFIKSSQWKQPAEARSDSMDAAAALSVEKYALFLLHLSCEDEAGYFRLILPVPDIPAEAVLQVSSVPLISLCTSYGSKDHRISHSLTAVTAAFTVVTVCFYHVIGII